MEIKLSFADIVDLFAAKTGQSKKDAEFFLRELLDVISSQMNVDGLVKLKDFGTFKVVNVESRESVDVNTGKRIVIASHKKISFTPDKMLKDLVNKPFSLFEPELLNDNITFEQTEISEDNSDEEEPDSEQVVAEDDETKHSASLAAISDVLSTVPLDSVIQETPAMPENEPVPEAETQQPAENQDQEPISIEKPEEEQEFVVEPESIARIQNDDLVFGKNNGMRSGKDEFRNKEDKEVHSKRLWAILGLCLAVVLISSALYFGYFQNTDEENQSKQDLIAANIDTTSEDSSQQQDAVVEDSLSQQMIDSEVKADSAKRANKPKPVIQPQPKSEPNPVSEPKSQSQPQPQKKVEPSISSKTVVVPDGYTFRLLALKYYGSKEFWAYIYQANKTKISHPNSLKSGLWVVIPDAKSLGIDANDPASVSRAKRLGEKVLNSESK